MKSDEDLVSACLRKDPPAYGEFLDRFQNDVFRLCLRMVGNVPDAEDVAQESFVRMFKYMERWDRTRSLKPWVLQIAANRCRTLLSNRRPPAIPLSAGIDIADPRSSENTTELSAEIRKAVDRLRGDYRQVFILFHERGFDYAMIAEAVGKPVGTVKTWLHRARVEVMEFLKERGMLEERLDHVKT